MSQTKCETHVQDSALKNAEMRDPSTTHGTVITHFCVARRQGVNRLHGITTQKVTLWVFKVVENLNHIQGYYILQCKRTFISECSVPKKLHLKHFVSLLYNGMYNNSGDSSFWHRCCWRINSTGILLPVERVWHSRKFRYSDNNILLVSNWPSRAI